MPLEAARRRLDSWKAIATYLERDVTTVRRWERREGLPVHRHLHDKLGSVFAYADEIDAWSQRRSQLLARPDATAAAKPEPLPLPTAQPAPASGARSAWPVGLALTVVTLVLVGLAAVTMRQRSSDQAETGAAGKEREGMLVDSLALSPDGQQSAFTAIADHTSRLWIRTLASPSSRALAGTEGASFPFWSPNGLEIGFFAGGRLKAISLASQKIRDLAPAQDGRGGTWSEDGDIVFAPDADASLFRVSASGGSPVPATSLPRGYKEGHGWPEFLPDGRHVLYTNYGSAPDRFGICVLDLETGASKRIVKTYSSASYSRDGFLLFASGSLVAQRFDLERLELSGDPVVVFEKVLVRYNTGHKVEFSLSRTGLIAVRGLADERSRLTWFDPQTGGAVGAIGEPALYSNPALSPKGTQLLVTITEPDFSTSTLWLFDVATATGSPLRSANVAHAMDVAPVWSPHGESVVFASWGSTGLLQHDMRTSGIDQPVLLLKMMQIPESWTTDGRYLTFSTLRSRTRFDVWAWQMADERRAFPLIEGPGNEGQSQVSPDGRFIAYASDESGRFEVYVQSFPQADRKWQISTDGGSDPHWRRDGSGLYFIAANRMLMSVSMASDGMPRGKPRTLFDTHLETLWQDTRNHFDVAPDGRILLLSPLVDRRATPYTLINWRPSAIR